MASEKQQGRVLSMNLVAPRQFMYFEFKTNFSDWLILTNALLKLFPTSIIMRIYLGPYKLKQSKIVVD